MALAPIKWDSKIILAKIETTYGVDPVPAGDTNAILATNVELRPMEGQDVSRNLERPFIGGQEEIPAGLYAMLTYSVELVGSGETGVAPAWGPLMRACGISETVTADDTPGDGTVEYAPVTDNQESIAQYFFIGTTRHVLLGCRGTVTLTLSAQGIPTARFALTGLFATPTNQTRDLPDLSAFQVPQIVSNANTPTFSVNSVDLVLREFTFTLANDVQPRLLVGRETIEIVDRNEVIAATVEAVPLTTYNPFALSVNSTRFEVDLDHGTVAGKRFNFNAPVCSQNRLTGYNQQQKILEWPLGFKPLPVDGDDQWTITLT